MEDKCRKEYEEYITRSYFTTDDIKRIGTDRRYKDSYVQAYWNIWKEAYNRTAQNIGEGDVVPDWEEITEQMAQRFVNELELPYGAGKDPDIRKALHVFIKTHELFKKFVRIGVQVAEESAIAHKQNVREK